MGFNELCSMSDKVMAQMKYRRLINDPLSIKGKVTLKLFDADGNIKEMQTANTITDLGNALVADAMSSRAIALISHMAVGTGDGSKTHASTTLTTEIARVALDSTTLGTGSSDNKVTYVATFAAGIGTGALIEAGMFNATPAGTMFCFAQFSVINKGASDSLQLTWELYCGTT